MTQHLTAHFGALQVNVLTASYVGLLTLTLTIEQSAAALLAKLTPACYDAMEQSYILQIHPLNSEVCVDFREVVRYLCLSY